MREMHYLCSKNVSNMNHHVPFICRILMLVGMTMLAAGTLQAQQPQVNTTQNNQGNPNSVYNMNVYPNSPAPAEKKEKETVVKEVVKIVYVDRLPTSEFFKYGLTAGANISRAEGGGPGFMHTGWQFSEGGGYFVGLAFLIPMPLWDFLSLDLSFVYSQETINMETKPSPDQNIQQNPTLQYSDKLRSFQTPLHLRWDIHLPVIEDVMKMVPYIYAGPQYCFNLNSFDWYSLFDKDHEKVQQTTHDSKYNIDDINPDKNKTEYRVWKADMGFGILFNHHVQLYWNYSLPIDDTFSFRTVYDDATNKFRIGSHRVGVSYYF